MKTIKQLRRLINEEKDEGVIKVDVPTFIRIMELAREEIKNDEDIHFFTTELINFGDKVITMTEYMQAAKSIGK